MTLVARDMAADRLRHAPSCRHRGDNTLSLTFMFLTPSQSVHAFT